jgi:nucleoside 2-deoxyribosyltransferase
MNETKPKCYIAGMMTGDPDYKLKFDKAEEKLKAKGWIVINPAVLPEGFAPMEYYKVNMAMILICDTVFFLPNWINSRGAHLEMGYALGTGKRVVILKGDYDGTAGA